ncbi:asparaginase [Paenibacillus algicola]|nr:asparaginase [Paenibacillus algicola]
METALITEYRAGVVECLHSGHIAVVDDTGALAAWAGDPSHLAFTRSSAKPLQLIPSIMAGVHTHYGLTEQELAVMVSSHRGEPEHQAVLAALMMKLGVEEERLVCAPSYPLDRRSRDQLLLNGAGMRRLYHNCSGKHLGMLASCSLQQFPMEGYEDPSHPLQQQVLNSMASMSGLTVEQISVGIDGCGLPVFALPLQSLAAAYVKLACPDLISDPGMKAAVQVITSAMTRHPYMVGGRNRLDTLLMEDDNIIAKGGFKGIFCFGLKKERLGIVLKVLDGSEEEWAWITESILEQLGSGSRPMLEKLRQTYTRKLLNDGGQQVGHVETVFTLQR